MSCELLVKITKVIAIVIFVILEKSQLFRLVQALKQVKTKVAILEPNFLEHRFLGLRGPGKLNNTVKQFRLKWLTIRRFLYELIIQLYELTALELTDKMRVK